MPLTPLPIGRIGGTYLEDTSNKFPYTLYCAYLPPCVRTLLIFASPEAEAAAEELDPFVAMFNVQTLRAKGSSPFQSKLQKLSHPIVNRK